MTFNHSSTAHADERDLIVERVRKLGSAASNAVLDPNCKVFTIPEIEGIIGYRIESSCAVVYGTPMCAIADRHTLVHAFHSHCQKQNMNIIYVAANENFAKWAIENVCKGLVEFGEELFIDPHADPKARQGVDASLVRRKVRHALKEGAVFCEYTPNNPEIEKELEKVSHSWLQHRHGPQVHISHVNLFSDRMGKRWFYVKKGEAIVGVVMLNQLQTHQGWLLNHLMFTPDAPHGTPEFLLTSTLEILSKEDCHFVTFGSVPSACLGEIIGLSKLTSWLSRILFKISHKLLKLEGRKKFWSKFHPQSQPSYLLFSQPRIGRHELIALMRAMNVAIPRK